MLYLLLLLNGLFSTSTVVAPTATIVKWTTETEHDFGAVQRGSTQRFTFRFQNLLDEPIVLQNVRTSCGCTAADWPEAPIDPAATGEIRIEFDADRADSFRKKITVFFNKQRRAETLWISGEVF